MQPRIPSAFSSARHAAGSCSAVSTKIPVFFSNKLLSSWVAPACPGAWGYFPPRCRILHFSVELHEVPVIPFLQPAALNGSTTLWPISHSFQLCVICKLADGKIFPILQIVNEDLKQGWSSSDPWDTPTGLCTTDDHLRGLAVSQFSNHLTVCSPSSSMMILRDTAPYWNPGIPYLLFFPYLLSQLFHHRRLSSKGKHDFPLLNPYWLLLMTFLSSVCLEWFPG